VKLIVDAYNVMHADDEIAALMDSDLEAARELLISRLSEYCEREGCQAEAVFDAGAREGGLSRRKRGELLTVTYTAQGQSADDYIEKLIYQSAGPTASTTVVTGDYAQQKIAGGAGVLRLPPREFLSRMDESARDLREEIAPGRGPRKRSKLADRLPDDTVAALERLRRPQK
jgi:uncharacterized protein